MSAFASEFRTESQYTTGQNGALELKTSGSVTLDSFVNILKDTEPKTVHENVKQMVNDISYLTSEHEKAMAIHDIFILAFHKRSTSKFIDGEQISDGEGLKNVYYEYILELYNFYPQTIVSLVNQRDMFMFGYWKDIYLMWEKINKLDMTIEEKYTKFNPLISAFRNAIIQQRGEDLDYVYKTFGNGINGMNEVQFNSLLNSNPDINLSISFVGKYCVRENSSFDKKCYWYMKDSDSYNRCSLVDYMIRATLKTNVNGVFKPFSIHKTIPFGAKKSWRKDNVKLNVILNVPENKFCSNKWSEIKFKNIPSVCLKQKTKALLNEKLKADPTSAEKHSYTGDRFPSDTDRVGCRQNFIEYIATTKGVNCSQLFPHQIIGNGLNEHVSTHEKLVCNKQWDSLIEYTKERIYNSVDTSGCKAISQGNILCCADVSGSMEMYGKAPNRPMDIAVALTAFISEIANDNYKDLAMSFTDVPEIIELRKNNTRMDMYDRIKALKSRVGYSTNYVGVHTCLIDLCKRKNIKYEDIPVLVIFSDGHFDNQIRTSTNSNSKMTTHQYVVKLWLDAGYRGAPQIVYWNLADNKNSVQVNSTFPNVQLLSGAGVSNIKYVLYGEQLEETTQKVVIDGEVVTVSGKSITPEQTMRKALDEPYFDSIRHVLTKSKEGYLNLFSY